VVEEQWLIEISPKRTEGPAVTEAFGDDFSQCILRAYQLVQNLGDTHDINVLIPDSATLQQRNQIRDAGFDQA
jgi:hypothetical protein